MSTSFAEATPLHYMVPAPYPNVLWELRVRSEDDVGFHVGADVSMLSQFGGERECLFPPLTMLRVLPRESAAPPPVSCASESATAPEAFPEQEVEGVAGEVRVHVEGAAPPVKQATSRIARRRRLRQLIALVGKGNQHGGKVKATSVTTMAEIENSRQQLYVTAEGSHTADGLAKVFERVCVVPTFTG